MRLIGFWETWWPYIIGVAASLTVITLGRWHTMRRVVTEKLRNRRLVRRYRKRSEKEGRNKIVKLEQLQVNKLDQLRIESEIRSLVTDASRFGATIQEIVQASGLSEQRVKQILGTSKQLP